MAKKHIQPAFERDRGSVEQQRTEPFETPSEGAVKGQEYPLAEGEAREKDGGKGSSMPSSDVKIGATQTTQQDAKAISALTAEVNEELSMIEGILQEGLEGVYKSMPAEKQQEFRVKGEETARNIQTMVRTMKLKTQRIIHWIMEWLKIIPGVSKLFLHQEAKLKTDKILEHLKEKKEDEGVENREF